MKQKGTRDFLRQMEKLCTSWKGWKKNENNFAPEEKNGSITIGSELRTMSYCLW